MSQLELPDYCVRPTHIRTRVQASEEVTASSAPEQGWRRETAEILFSINTGRREKPLRDRNRDKDRDTLAPIERGTRARARAYDSTDRRGTLKDQFEQKSRIGTEGGIRNLGSSFALSCFWIQSPSYTPSASSPSPKVASSPRSCALDEIVLQSLLISLTLPDEIYVSWCYLGRRS